MTNNFSRRNFLTTMGATVGASLVGKSLFDVSKVLATTGPYVRPNVNGSMANLTSYINGVTAMKALPMSDPRNWYYQAAIHGIPTGSAPDWNTCQHGPVNFFWPWHRMYLYWFERIVRSQSGDPTWALPYWDWQANPTLPAMFQVSGNPALYVSSRAGAINNGSAGVGNQTPGVNNAFGQPIFETPVAGTPLGADELIQQPHNNVHVNVGGCCGWMSNTSTAAKDPIFFLHHANVDRLWNLWLTQSGGQSDPTMDSAWEGMVFSFFDENANPVSMTPCDVLRAALQLNYSYENEPGQVNQYCGNTPLCTASYQTVIDNCIQKPPFYLRPGNAYSYYEFPVNYQLEQQIYGYIKNPANTLYLTHYGVTSPTQPGVVFDTYVGLPIGSQPSQKSPYYVGSYGMYGAGVADDPPDGNEPASFGYPVNKAILTALQKLPKGGNIPVTLFPTGIAGPTIGGPMQKATVTIQGAQLTLQTVTQSGKAAGNTKKEKEKVVAKLSRGR